MIVDRVPRRARGTGVLTPGRQMLLVKTAGLRAGKRKPLEHGRLDDGLDKSSGGKRWRACDYGSLIHFPHCECR